MCILNVEISPAVQMLLHVCTKVTCRIPKGHSKLFQGGVAKVYIPCVVSREVWGMLPQENINSVITIGYLLEVFTRLWIPSLVCIFTSAWS